MFESSRRRLIASACALAVLATGAIGIVDTSHASAAVVKKCSGQRIAAESITYQGEVIGELVVYKSGKTACVSTNHLGKLYGKKVYTDAWVTWVDSTGEPRLSRVDQGRYAYRAAVKYSAKGGCFNAFGGVAHPEKKSGHPPSVSIKRAFCI